MELLIVMTIYVSKNRVFEESAMYRKTQKGVTRTAYKYQKPPRYILMQWLVTRILNI